MNLYNEVKICSPSRFNSTEPFRAYDFVQSLNLNVCGNGPFARLEIFLARSIMQYSYCS